MAAVLTANTDQGGVPGADTSFDSYARLLRMLVPSLCAITLHDGRGRLLWRSDEWDLADRPQILAAAFAEARSEPARPGGVLTRLDVDHAAYTFIIRGREQAPLGAVSLVTRLPATQSEPRPLPTVRQLVQPALDCLQRELQLRAQIGMREDVVGEREREVTVRERDLALMVQMSLPQPEAGGDADEFERILQSALEHIGCAFAALWVPDKSIFLSVTRSGQPMPEESLQRAQQHLFAWMRLQQRTLVINHVSKVAGEVATPYKILACPVLHRSERVMGLLALFNPPNARDFDAHQSRLAELLAHRAVGVIQSQFDAGTGLLTRQAFERQAMTALRAAPQDTHSILYLDIDRLHIVNETFGMHVGDEVIAGVAGCLTPVLVAPAFAARISGDRLAAFLPHTEVAEAATVAERIRQAAERLKPRVGRGMVEVSVCVGVAPVGRSDNALAHALATAEIACKAAKDRGRNRVELFQDSDQSIIRRHTDVLIVGTLRDALDHGSFRLDAQPILPLRGNYGRPRFELLIRMLGENGEIVAPGKFLSSAERYQLMPAVDRWVVRHACELLGAHGGAVGGEIARFAVNLSGQSLQDDSFLDFVVARIEESRLPPSVLCFELTETATIGNLAKAQQFMRRLQDLGCQFALDDFGTGVSSLAYLKDLSVDYLKIDGSFVRDAIVNSRSESMIKAIAQLAKVMCMETIAEYVETDALRVRMADLGVDYGQGFAMGRAQPLQELLRELAVFEASVDTWAPARAV